MNEKLVVFKSSKFSEQIAADLIAFEKNLYIDMLEALEADFQKYIGDEDDE